jgi:hypothetical protein
LQIWFMRIHITGASSITAKMRRWKKLQEHPGVPVNEWMFTRHSLVALVSSEHTRSTAVLLLQESYPS